MRERKTKTRKETHPALAAVVIAVVGLAAALASGAAVILQGLGESVIVVSREEEVMRKKCKEVSKEEEETDEGTGNQGGGRASARRGGGASVSDSLALAQLIFPRVLPRALFSRMNRQPPPTCGANTSKEACRRNHHGKRRRLEGSAGAAMRGLGGRVFFRFSLSLPFLPPLSTLGRRREKQSRQKTHLIRIPSASRLDPPPPRRYSD